MAWIVASACYHPLHLVPHAERLEGRSWPDALQRLVRRQVAEPQEERRLASVMRQLTPVLDRVSLEVQRQYEESPYPTWVVNPAVAAQRSIPSFLRSQFPFAPVHAAEASGPLSILIAGCGTGRHSIEVAQQFPDARVLAVDLSNSSLAYAQRKTAEIGLRNVEYAHADILGLGSLGERFDMIQSSGVLHHVHDPMLGWRTLVGLLKPHGIMHIGLYSQLARTGVVAARSFIASHGYRDTPDDIRRCRQDLLVRKGGADLQSVITSPDFFSTSACRDLLFHVQEHQMTLPQIAGFLAEQRLQFLGFALEPRALDHYRRRFPGDRGATNLANWHIFETENPATFAAMYQFWLQRNW
jgi:2-polyprenyl-3-methyl-5-hydroxy-6-metoxy-1,4-benzoquinol methylase